MSEIQKVEGIIIGIWVAVVSVFLKGANREG